MLNYTCNRNKFHSKAQSVLLEEIVAPIEAKTNYQRRLYANGYMLRCPVHGDNNPSLSVGEGYDGRILMHCFKGCSAKDVCASIGKKIRDLFPHSTR